MSNSPQIRAELRKLIRKEGRLFLLLDYDGTLVPFAATPEQARPPGHLLEMLAGLCLCPGLRVAVVSGRGIDDLKRLLPVRGLYLAGVHGLVIRYPTGEEVWRGEEGGEARAWVKKLTRKLEPLLEGKKGFLLENKDIALALHYRLAFPHEGVEVLRRICREVRPLLQEAGFVLRSGKKVLEFCPALANKGEGVKFLLSGWRGAFPVYLGDDDTDEDAFRAVAEIGLGVLISRHPRESAARYRLDDPGDVALFLADIFQDRHQIALKRFNNREFSRPAGV
ncbi:MAG: trehalose-phosphatase [Bacillota bacterium]|nr:trehalose-phosphatase [Bacillota bacterium]